MLPLTRPDSASSSRSRAGSSVSSRSSDGSSSDLEGDPETKARCITCGQVVSAGHVCAECSASFKEFIEKGLTELGRFLSNHAGFTDFLARTGRL